MSAGQTPRLQRAPECCGADSQAVSGRVPGRPRGHAVLRRISCFACSGVNPTRRGHCHVPKSTSYRNFPAPGEYSGSTRDGCARGTSRDLTLTDPDAHTSQRMSTQGMAGDSPDGHSQLYPDTGPPGVGPDAPGSATSWSEQGSYSPARHPRRAEPRPRRGQRGARHVLPTAQAAWGAEAP